MLLAIDVGNSNVVWGIFEQRTLKGHWRAATELSKTTDEYGMLFVTLLQRAGIGPDQVTGVILSSVVPALTPVFDAMVEAYFHRFPIVVSSDLDTGLQIRYERPHEIGSDRLVNAAAAYARYRCCLIVVDFGTATTFCTVTHHGEYLGGVIAPGIRTAAEALFTRTAKLPMVDLIRPKTVIGRDTATSMQSGLVFGFTDLVDGIVERMQRELEQKAMVIATGGLAAIIAPESRTIQEVRPYLTLEGLELLYRRARGDE